MEEALAHRECHPHENPLQAIVDKLTAKNVELEAKVQELTEKIAK
jgi:hypothetical protein